eukprot:EG_transcript_26039
MPTKTVDGCVYAIEPAAPPRGCCYDSEDEDRDPKHKRRRTTMPLVLREEDGLEVLAAMKTEVVVHKQVIGDAGSSKSKAAAAAATAQAAFEAEEADNEDALAQSRAPVPISAGTGTPAAARLHSQQFAAALLRASRPAAKPPAAPARTPAAAGRPTSTTRSVVRLTA